MSSRHPARYPPPLPPQPEGLRDGLCARHPVPGLWSSRYQPERELALSICASCPVLLPCRAWALSFRTADDLVMILGGLTPRERKLIRAGRQRGAATAPPPSAVITPPGTAA